MSILRAMRTTVRLLQKIQPKTKALPFNKLNKSSNSKLNNIRIIQNYTLRKTITLPLQDEKKVIDK